MNKVTEIFLSSQGEGYYTGVPSVFIRLFGCNFTCGSFGMAPGTVSTERDKIAENIDQYKTFKDIPLAHTGCDSFPSWDVRFKKFSKDYSDESVLATIQDLVLPLQNSNSNFLHIEKNRNVHIVITGGEPLLYGRQLKLLSLLETINNQMMQQNWYLTFETNGTQILKSELIDFFNSNTNIEVTFSVSPKLSESGEPWARAIKPDVIANYALVSNRVLYLKYVVGREDEFEEVKKATLELSRDVTLDEVYIMPVGGCYEEYIAIAPKVAIWCIARGYRYSPRLHVDLFRNSWGV